MLASIVFVSNLINSHYIFANSINKFRTKYDEIFPMKSMWDASTYSSKSRYDPCKNHSRTNSSIETIIRCQSYIESMLKKFQIRRRLATSRENFRKILKSKNIPGCGIKDGPLSYSAGRPW